jgi:hypothetical protein
MGDKIGMVVGMFVAIAGFSLASGSFGYGYAKKECDEKTHQAIVECTDQHNIVTCVDGREIVSVDIITRAGSLQCPCSPELGEDD